MSLTVTGDDIHDVRRKVSQQSMHVDIRISWRRDKLGDFDRIHKTGAVIDATSIHGEEVPRSFENSAIALHYVGALLKKHDIWVREQSKEREKEKKEKEKNRSK